MICGVENTSFRVSEVIYHACYERGLYKHEDSSLLNRIFVPIVLRCMLEGKDYRYLDIVLHVVFGYAYTWIGFEEHFPINQDS